jgi:hypothetical protein
MPQVAIYEAFPSRETVLSDRPAIDLCYVILGLNDEAAATQMLLGATPTVYRGMLRQSAQLKQVAPDVFECSVRYGGWKLPEAGDWKWEFDTAGANQKITQSLGTLNAYAPPGSTPPDFKGAIGVTDDAVEGCDIVVPQFKWSETHQIDQSECTWTYSQTLFALTGTTNKALFRGFYSGWVLFLGAKGSASAKNPSLVELTFQFAAQQPVNNQTIGTIAGIHKDPWAYLWVRYGTKQDNNANKLVKLPTSVHVEQVYQSGDFSQLGIGN